MICVSRGGGRRRAVARQGRQRRMAQIRPQGLSYFYGSLVSDENGTDRRVPGGHSRSEEYRVFFGTQQRYCCPKEAIELAVIESPVIDLEAAGRNITRLRKDRGLSVRDLQERFGLEVSQAICKCQHGRCLPRREEYPFFRPLSFNLWYNLLYLFADEPEK